MPAPVGAEPVSAYVHIPFCAAKCGYCDFNSYAGLMGLSGRYVNALCRQISSAGGSAGALETVNFGGGTPSILPAPDLLRILDTVRNTFGISDTAEVTLEANPESAALEKLRALREGGFNRISIGAQSFDNEMLIKIGRVHSHERFLQAYGDAVDAGFTNISFDLMFGLPGQDMNMLEKTLQEAIGLRPDHISAYCLTIEERTEFHLLAGRGLLQVPDQDLQADMFLAIKDKLTGAGYEHYEISNYARPGRRCLHNEAYWRNEPYLGFGCGAVQYSGGERVKWESDPQAYTDQMEFLGCPAKEETEHLTGPNLIGETAMLALRTSVGLDAGSFAARFGIDLYRFYDEEIKRYLSAGLISQDDGYIRLSQEGLLLANEVTAAFLR